MVCSMSRFFFKFFLFLIIFFSFSFIGSLKSTSTFAALSCTSYSGSGIYIGTWSGSNKTNNNACTRAGNACSSAGCQKCVLGAHTAPCSYNATTGTYTCQCAVNGSQCPINWSCSTTICNGCYYDSGVSCGTTVRTCHYNSSVFSSSCGSSCSTSTCTAGTGSTNASCGGVSGYQCTGTGSNCEQYTYRCTGSPLSCQSGAHASGQSQSLCCSGGRSCSNSSCVCPSGTTWNGSSCVTATLVNGACSSPATHFNCASGTSTNNVTGATSWTWTCAGSGGGTSPSCSQSITPVVNGVCSSPATHYSCTAGTSTNNVNGATSWTWTCAGSGGGTSPSCSEIKPTYSISGTVFNDLNHDGKFDCIDGTNNLPSCPGSYPEPAYSGATLTLSQGATTLGTTVSLASGGYSFTGLAGGTYNVNLTIPSGYTLVSSNPRIVPLPPSATGIDFAITNSTKPWFQSVSGDMIQNGFTDTVPTGAASATPPYNGGGSYASVWGIGQTPGIIYSGSLDPDFGLGSASNPGWVAGNSSYPEPFVSGNTPLETSYNNVNALLAKYGKTATPLTSVCNPGDCNLSSIADGIYQYTGGGTVNFNDFSGTSAGFTLSGNKNVIILIDGTLNINEKIHVAVGSTLFITTSGNIVVDKSLGEAATDYCRVPWDGVYSGDGGCTIEGYYSTDKSFDLNGTKNCGINPDLRFNLGGSLVINASGIGGTLNLNRDLCSAGATYPTFSVTERADFVLYSPNFFKTQRRIWQEVNP